MLRAVLTSTRCACRWLANYNIEINYIRRIYSPSHRLFSTRSDLDMEHLQHNPYFSKYAEKLKQVQASSPEQFQHKVDELLAGKKPAHSKSSGVPEPPVQVKPERLESVMKLELVQQKSQVEITELWKAYHAHKDCVFAVIPAPEYDEIYRKSKDFPTFVYPVPRGDGYEFFVQRWDGHICHFTPLLSYQTYKENAAPCLSLVHYTELMDEKGIVLMRGEPATSVLSVYESQLLALQVKMYYGLYSGLKFNYVRMFNNTPDSFSHADLIREFDNYKKRREGENKAWRHAEL